MRLFIAIELDCTSTSRLARITDDLRSVCKQGSFTLKENFHLTLAFLGETAISDIPAITKAMDDTIVAPFTMHVTNLGYFKRPNGDVWWAGIKMTEQLLFVQRQLADMVSSHGIWVDPKPFVAHITLARSVRLIHQDEARRLLSRTIDFSLSVHHLTLMQSDRINGKLTYIPLYKRTL